MVPDEWWQICMTSTVSRRCVARLIYACWCGSLSFVPPWRSAEDCPPPHSYLRTFYHKSCHISTEASDLTTESWIPIPCSPSLLRLSPILGLPVSSQRRRATNLRLPLPTTPRIWVKPSEPSVLRCVGATPFLFLPGKPGEVTYTW